MADEAKKQRKQVEGEEQQARFLRVLESLQGKGESEDAGMVCNNSVNGGDCYGESFCDDFECGDAHKLHHCACGIKFCGCCLKMQQQFVTCLLCNTEPVEREGAPAMSTFFEAFSTSEEFSDC
jgi:hypothetical protein